VVPDFENHRLDGVVEPDNPFPEWTMLLLIILDQLHRVTGVGLEACGVTSSPKRQFKNHATTLLPGPELYQTITKSLTTLC